MSSKTNPQIDADSSRFWLRIPASFTSFEQEKEGIFHANVHYGQTFKRLCFDTFHISIPLVFPSSGNPSARTVPAASYSYFE
jgi:hypothetical protein